MLFLEGGGCVIYGHGLLDRRFEYQRYYPTFKKMDPSPYRGKKSHVWTGNIGR